MGLIHYIKAQIGNKFDMIPCDYVSNIIVTSTVYTAREPQPTLNIATAGTSQKNPMFVH